MLWLFCRFRNNRFVVLECHFLQILMSARLVTVISDTNRSFCLLTYFFTYLLTQLFLNVTGVFVIACYLECTSYMRMCLKL